MNQDGQRGVASHPFPSSVFLLFSAHPRYIHTGVLLSIYKVLQSCHISRPLSMFPLLKCIQLALTYNSFSFRETRTGEKLSSGGSTNKLASKKRLDTHISVIFAHSVFQSSLQKCEALEFMFSELHT